MPATGEVRASPFDEVRVSPFDAAPVPPQYKSPFDVPRSSSGSSTAGWHVPYGHPVAPAAPEEEAPDVHVDGARYFVITSNTKENVVKSVKHGLWATQRKNEAKLDEAFRTAPAVILVFSVNRSEAFHGYAVMRSRIGHPRPCSIDPFNGFGRLFDVEWLRLHDLDYRDVEHIRNSLNNDQLVKSSRDGQELSASCGRRLCGLIDRHIDEPESFAPAPHPHMQAGVPMPFAYPPPGAPFSGAPAGAPYFGAGGMPPGMRPRAASSDSSTSRGRRRKRRRERKYRNAPNSLEKNFDEQLEFFLSLEYDDYVRWWKRNGTASPGPTLPPPHAAMGHPPHAPLMALPAPPAAMDAPPLALGM